jgi:NADH-quinone oxidoreductase subunit M
VFTIIAAVSLVFAGLYGLILIHKALFGSQTLNKTALYNPIKDLNLREVVILMICLIGLVWLGLYPTNLPRYIAFKHAMVSQ